MVFQEIFKKGYKGIANVLFPKRCISCRGYGVWFCATCNTQAQVRIPVGACTYCHKSYTKLSSIGALCDTCKKMLHLDGLLYYYSYKDEGITRVLHVIKYKGVTEVLTVLARSMRARFNNTPFVSRPIRLTDTTKEKIILIPIPLHQRKQRARGFNQSLLLSEALASFFKWNIDAALLKKRRATLSQTKLTKEERQENIEGAFIVQKDIKKDFVYVLVDDVITTGTTIGEAARVLKKAGARHVWGMVVARG